MTALLVLALSFAACEKPAPEPEPQPEPQPEALTFDVEVTGVAKTEATFNITPSDLEAEYLVVVAEAQVVESSESDAALVLKLITS